MWKMEINGLDSEKLFLMYVLTFVECFKGSYHLSPCNLSKESQRSEILRMLHDSPQLQCVYSNPWPSSVVSENKWNMIKLASHS